MVALAVGTAITATGADDFAAGSMTSVSVPRERLSFILQPLAATIEINTQQQMPILVEFIAPGLYHTDSGFGDCQALVRIGAMNSA
jgi:hypothetical protein